MILFQTTELLLLFIILSLNLKAYLELMKFENANFLPSAKCGGGCIYPLYDILKPFKATPSG